jgi:mannan endo-1,4-beta-mannosidase
MKSNKLLNICAIAIMSLSLVACGGGGGSDEPTQPTVTPTLSVASQSISEGSVVSTTTTSIVIGYSAAIALNTANSVTLNGAAVTPTVSNTALNIPLSLSDGVDYTLVIPANAVHRSDNASVYAPAVTIHFSTAAAAAGLVNANATAQALKVYQFLKDEYGKKTLSGSMANVANNNYISDWIYAVTGKHPALTCYDFVHLADSPPTGLTTAIFHLPRRNGPTMDLLHICGIGEYRRMKVMLCRVMALTHLGKAIM